MSDFIVDFGRLLNPIDNVVSIISVKIFIVTFFGCSLLYLDLCSQLSQIAISFVDNLKNSSVLSGINKLVVFS